MSANSSIEWTDHTFNPWRGCTKVSPGCAHCYAETLSKRNPKVLGEWGPGKPRVLASEAMWREPVKWERVSYTGHFRQCPECGWRGEVKSDDMDCPTPGCECAGLDMMVVRPRVFSASLADWLDEEVPIEWLARLLKLIFETPHLDWLLLTKRPQNWEDRLLKVWTIFGTPPSELEAFDLWLQSWRVDRTPPANVWIGTTVEDQARAEERIPRLLEIPAKVRFLSCEPLLGAVRIKPHWLWREEDMEATGNFRRHSGKPQVLIRIKKGAEKQLHWVICGGESGPQARPMHPAWARGLRDQCAAAGVPFFFKQWGEWRPQFALHAYVDDDGDDVSRGDFTGWERVGKKAAGRLLDGVEHSAFPIAAGTAAPRVDAQRAPLQGGDIAHPKSDIPHSI